MSEISSDLIEKFEVHASILKAVKDGLMAFCGQRDKYLIFEIPSLQDHDSCVELFWHGSDSKTWHLEGLRFYAERVYDHAGSDEAWTPELVGDEQTPEDHEYNVDAFIGWLESQ